ncbi:hypothetical protein OBBRIDRAFT_889328 [Obba rivulosa]|uniref:Uncharacterized protein n=1 Tax=Obba rivulosa TaxID=1052685 RepID=A0A8E2DIK5_9APHY|nr:hypothetical protein OBBRIDRAFT_889328 [Obba rivulosa]
MSMSKISKTQLSEMPVIRLYKYAKFCRVSLKLSKEEILNELYKDRQFLPCPSRIDRSERRQEFLRARCLKGMSKIIKSVIGLTGRDWELSTMIRAVHMSWCMKYDYPYVHKVLPKPSAPPPAGQESKSKHRYPKRRVIPRPPPDCFVATISGLEEDRPMRHASYPDVSTSASVGSSKDGTTSQHVKHDIPPAPPLPADDPMDIDTETRELIADKTQALRAEVERLRAGSAFLQSMLDGEKKKTALLMECVRWNVGPQAAVKSLRQANARAPRGSLPALRPEVPLPPRAATRAEHAKRREARVALEQARARLHRDHAHAFKHHHKRRREETRDPSGGSVNGSGRPSKRTRHS